MVREREGTSAVARGRETGVASQRTRGGGGGTMGGAVAEDVAERAARLFANLVVHPTITAPLSANNDEIQGGRRVAD